MEEFDPGEHEERSEEREMREERPERPPRLPTKSTGEITHPETVQARARRIGKDGSPNGNVSVHEGARRYVREHKIAPGIPDSPYVHNNVPLQTQIAQFYDRAKHAPRDSRVAKAYGAFSREVNDQWHFATRPVAEGGLGMTFEPWMKAGQPYANSAEMRKDVAGNHHLWFFQGGELPHDHPMAAIDLKTGLSHNDKFRAVHDLFGHSAMGFDFGPRGEENAWREHAKMFSQEARKALATETRGQNSWVNYGPHGEANQASKSRTVYPDQKAVLLPDWALQTEDLTPPGKKGRGSSVMSRVAAERATTPVKEDPQSLAEIAQAGFRPENDWADFRSALQTFVEEGPKALSRQVREQLSRVPSHIKAAFSGLPEPEGGWARPGELNQLPVSRLPNRAVFDRLGVKNNSNKKGSGYYVPETPESRAGRGVREPVAQIGVNPRSPAAFEDNPQMFDFFEQLRQNIRKIASGLMEPEGYLMPWFATLGSVQRRATSYPQFLERAWVDPAHIQDVGADLNPRKGPIGEGNDQLRGILIRPEIALPLIASDPTNPSAMKMLAAIMRPEDFHPEERARLIQEGVDDIFSRFRASGQATNNQNHLLGGEDFLHTGNPAQVKGGWEVTQPQVWNAVRQWAQAKTGDKKATNPFVGLDDKQQNRLLLNTIQDIHPQWVGPTKSPFTLGMSVTPDFATLDTRILHDIFGLHPDMMSHLTPDERDELQGKMMDAIKHAESPYGAQWLFWQYNTGEHTTYNSLPRMMDKVSGFMKEARSLAERESIPLAEAIDRHSASIPRNTLVPMPGGEVETRIGISAPLAHGLGEGASGQEILERAPEILQLARKAGLHIVNAGGTASNAKAQAMRGLTTGRGFWQDEKTGRLYHEPDLDLVVRGNKAAVEWFAAALGRHYNQNSVMVAHTGRGQAGGHIGQIDVESLNPLQAKELAESLRQHIPSGWHIGYNRSGGGKLVFALPGSSQEGAAIIHEKVGQALARNGLQMGQSQLLPGEVKFINEPEFDTRLRAGPLQFGVAP